MKNKLFKKNNQRLMENGQRKTVLSPEGHLSGRAATLSRVARLSSLLLLLFPLLLSAQNGVTVSNLDVKPGTVTFNVSWRNTGMPTLWSDSVWVFVDYNNAGKMERLLLSGATLSAPSWSAATVIFGKDDNYQGAWVVGNARQESSFSATVQLLAATAAADLAGACAYASNYPPVGEYKTSTQIVFTGTPPYNLVLVSEGSGTRTYSINDNYYNLYEGETLQSFSDKTGASGTIIIKCHAPGATGVTFAAFNPCADAPYGSTYTLTDDRDKKQYKVKYMPDARYWMVQDLAFGEKCETKTSMANTSTAGNITDNGTYYGNCFKPNCNLDSYGYVYNNTGAMNYGVTSTTYTCSGTTAGTLTNAPSTCRGICPVGWHVPTTAEISSMSSLTISSALCTNAVEAIFTSCGFNNSPCEYWNDNNSTNISTSSGVIYYWWFDTAVEGTSNWSHPGFTRCTMNY